jgi:hypothetical protein
MLDAGEAEAIALAVERNPSLLLIDERDGRQIARALDVAITGTLGVLLRAKTLGHVSAIKPLLTELIQQHQFRLHPDLVKRVLVEAGEAPASRYGQETAGGDAKPSGGNSTR